MLAFAERFLCLLNVSLKQDFKVGRQRTPIGTCQPLQLCFQDVVNPEADLGISFGVYGMGYHMLSICC